MPESTVEAGDDIYVAVPAEGAKRFIREALDNLANAGSQVEEAVKAIKHHATRKADRLDSEDLPRLHVAAAVWERIERDEDGGLRVTGEPDALMSVVRGCALAALEDLDGDLGMIAGPPTPAKVRSARVLAAELGVWIDLIDSLTTAETS